MLHFWFYLRSYILYATCQGHIVLVCRFAEMSISIMMGNAPGPEYVGFERKKKTSSLKSEMKITLGISYILILTWI